MISSFLFLAKTTDMGLGVFTSENIEADTLIETSPVLIFTKEERTLLDQTLLHDYIFEWGINKDQCCIGLGYISIYNHSYQSNCEYKMDYDAHVISIVTMRLIKAGEELFINYNGDWNDTRPVWFDQRSPHGETK